MADGSGLRVVRMIDMSKLQRSMFCTRTQVEGIGLSVYLLGLRVEGCGLGVEGCGLRVAGCGLRVAG